MVGITVRVNGEARQTRARTVGELALELTDAPQTLLIERNQVALHRSEWPTTSLVEGDVIEVLKVSAGG